MNKSAVFLVLLSISLLSVVACAADSPETVVASVASPTEPPPTATPVATPPALLSPPGPPDFSSLENFEDAERFLRDLGEPRGFPVALMDSSPQLPREAAAALWELYLRDSRVVETRNGRARKVIDYCQTTSTIHFEYETTGWYNGLTSAWEIRYSENTVWNRPRIVVPNPTGPVRAAFLRRGYNSVPGGTLNPPEGHELPSFDVGLKAKKFWVFDNPDCVNVKPSVDHDSIGSAFLGAVESRTILDFIALDEPQLDEQELLSRWHGFLDDLVIFSNFQEGGLTAIFCGDGLGIRTDRYADKEIHGRPFNWSLQNGQNVARNAIWIFEDYFDPDDRLFVAQRQYLLDLEAQLDPRSAMVAAGLSNCSIEQGRQYLSTLELPRQ